jgi:hypothetical protein
MFFGLLLHRVHKAASDESRTYYFQIYDMLNYTPETAPFSKDANVCDFFSYFNLELRVSILTDQDFLDSVQHSI